MITKKDFAEYIINRHAESEGISPDEVKKYPRIHVGKSTSCGLALEYLGFLNDYKLEKEYLVSRAGSFISVFDEENEPCMRSLSIREMFELLPESLPEL
jgi:hypothetical protein